jgi:hypothetical protein
MRGRLAGCVVALAFGVAALTSCGTDEPSPDQATDASDAATSSGNGSGAGSVAPASEAASGCPFSPEELSEAVGIPLDEGPADDSDAVAEAQGGDGICVFIEAGTSPSDLQASNVSVTRQGPRFTPAELRTNRDTFGNLVDLPALGPSAFSHRVTTDLQGQVSSGGVIVYEADGQVILVALSLSGTPADQADLAVANAVGLLEG